MLTTAHDAFNFLLLQSRSNENEDSALDTLLNLKKCRLNDNKKTKRILEGSV